MTASSAVLRNILQADCCSGCGACAFIAPAAIAMDYTPEGFLRPIETAEIDPAAARQIEKVCPGMSLNLETAAATDHLLWGPIVASRTGHATDPELRHHASSGGAISALLGYLIDSKSVDFVVETAASASHPTRNRVVVSQNSGDIYASAGSRYSPSAPLEHLQQYLDRPGRFALVGKPCDIAAVRALIDADGRLRDKIPYLISFFCAGVPSTRGADRIVQAMGVAEKDLKSFRYRGDGWPGQAAAETASGAVHRMNYADSWGNILSKHLQFRCKICPDGSGAFADVVCGDAWDSDERGSPKFSEGDGRSLILSRTETGEKLCRMAEQAGAIATRALDPARIESMQPAQARRKRLVMSRLWAMRIGGRSVPRFRGLQLRRAARSAGAIANIKSFLGLCRRLAMGRARS